MKIRGVLFAVCVLAGSGAACRSEQEKSRLPVTVQCSANDTLCVAELGDRHVTLDMSPRPITAMTDIRFTVWVSGDTLAGNPFIDLNMAAMNMGPNRVELKPMADGSFAGTGVIVKCTSGLPTWKATVHVPEVGDAEFVFHVKY